MYLIQEQIILPNNQIRFITRLKLKQLPENIINEFSLEEWEDYVQIRAKKSMFEERKFFIIKATNRGFINLLGAKQFIKI